MVFMPEYAHLVALAFLGTAAAIGAGIVLTVYFWQTGRPRHARICASVVGGIAVSYTLIGVGASVTSDELDLQRGQRKYICEVDCHLSYSVTDVQKSQTVLDGDKPTSTDGIFWTVTVAVLFDKETISKRRPLTMPLSPDPRMILAVDEYGRVYRDFISVPRDPWARALRPGESFTFDLIFDFPSDVRAPRLLLTTDTFVDPFLIGHEQSLLHKKIWFTLESSES